MLSVALTILLALVFLCMLLRQYLSIDVATGCRYSSLFKRNILCAKMDCRFTVDALDIQAFVGHSEWESHSLIFPVLHISPAFPHGVQKILCVELPGFQFDAIETTFSYLTNGGNDMSMGVVHTNI